MTVEKVCLMKFDDKPTKTTHRRRAMRQDFLSYQGLWNKSEKDSI